MKVDLEGRHALVTGGGTGIGRAISLGLARCGASVVVNFNRSDADARQTVDQITKDGGQAIAVQADVTNESQVAALIEQSVAAFGGLDILIANAGMPTEVCPTTELTSDQWDRGFGLNGKSVFLCVKHAAPHLKDHAGRIIVTSSVSARSGGPPGTITYAAGKGAVANMVRNWAREFGLRGITVNAISPGIIMTRLHESDDPIKSQELIQRIPLGRVGQPEDCVGAVLLLASAEGAYITGQTIEINGGMMMP
jgi:3-oxoacyl-[acyl-carrier protein] reductase